jgi:predicted MFS family arabinose efflux permease
MPLPGSMMLSLAEPGRAGKRLGQLQSAGALGSAIALGAALVLTLAHVPIRPIYLIAGASGLLGAGVCLAIPRDVKTPGPRFVFRRRYGLFYLMSFFEGWRKQMALAFAGFLLVHEYHTSLRTILVLWGAVQAIAWIASPWVGRLIDRAGERKVLMLYYALMTLCFCGYALIRDRTALWILYVLDNTFFILAMALTTYVRRIAPPAEHTPTLGLGVAMNHVAAVLMPLLGGLLWRAYGYQAAFAVGIVAAVVSIGMASFIPAHRPGAGTAE